MKTDLSAGLLAVGLVVLFAAGCCGLKEGLRGFVGVSTKVLEDNLDTASSRQFDLDYKTAQALVLKTVADIKAYIYERDDSRKLIAVYVSRSDTTPVGIFLKSVDSARTTVSISSPSLYARDLIAGKVFAGLENK